MMKKLAVVLMFLGVVSVASAVLSLDVEVDGSDYYGQTLILGEIVTVKVIQSAENGLGAGGKITVDVLGTPGTFEGITGPAFPYGGWGWLVAGTMDYIGNQAYFAATAALGVGTPGTGSELGLPDYNMGVPYEQTFIFTFAISETQTLTIGGTWDGATSSASELITVIPEPMTMALLGLGGLFLRRRR